MANISFDLVYPRYNTMVVRIPHGTHLPDIENTSKVQGCTVEFTFRDGTKIKISETLNASKVVIENTPVEGQGTTSRRYRRWNLRMKTGSDTTFKYYDENDAYLGEKYDLKKKGLIDNLKYKCNKITAKKNIASFPQSHKMGSCNIYNDLYHDIVTDTQWTERIAVHQLPFIGFQEQDGVYTYIGHYTSGADKGDKSAFGYNVETAETSHQLQIEGPNHDPLGTLFQFPWLSSISGHRGFQYVAVDAAGEKVEGLRNEDLTSGNNEAWDVSIAGSHFDGSEWIENGTDVKEDEPYIQAILEEEWKPAYNLAFYTDQAIKYSANPAASAKVQINGVLYQLYDSTAEGPRLWFWNGSRYERIPQEEHDMWTYLGFTGTRSHKSEEAIKAARANKFKSDIANYFNKKSALFHYCFCILIGAKDNFAKNTYPQLHHSIATGGRWEWKQDDLDSILHTDNNGNPTLKYNIEFDDLSAQGTWIFQGGNSAFWRSIHFCYSADEIPTMMNSIVKAMVARSSKKDGSVHDRLFQFFDDYYFTKAQKYFPAKDYEGDFEWAYRQPWYDDRTKSYNNVLPLTQVVGDSLLGESQWLRRRILYVLSKYELDGFTKQQDDSYGVLEFRPAGDYDFNLVPALSFYPNINSGDSAVNFKPAVPRVEAKASAPIRVISSGGTTCYIKAMDYLEEVGDLCKLQLSMGSSLSVTSQRLRVLKLGDSDPSQVTTNIDTLTINCPALQELMLANTPVNSDMDLTKSKRLKSVDISHSEVTSILFAPGAMISNLKYSDKCTNIILPSLFNLNRANLTLPAEKNRITGVYVKDTPVEPISLIEELRNSSGSQLKYITSIWTEETDVTTEDLTNIFNMLQEASAKGYGHIDVDGDGNVSFFEDFPKFEGSLHVDQVVSIVKQYIEDNTNITIHADSVIYPTPEQVGLTLTPTDISTVPENELYNVDLTASVLDTQYSMYNWSVDKYANKSWADVVTTKLSATSEKGAVVIREPKYQLIAEDNKTSTVPVRINVYSLADPSTIKSCTYNISSVGISNIVASSNVTTGLKEGDHFQITIDDSETGTSYGTKPKSFLQCISTGAQLTKVSDTVWQGTITETAEDSDVVVTVTTKYPNSNTGEYTTKDIVLKHVNAPSVEFSITRGSDVADVLLYSWREETSEWKLFDSNTFTKYMKVKAVVTSNQPGYIAVWSDDWVPEEGSPDNERIWEFVDGKYPNGWTGEVSAVNMAIVLTYNVPEAGTVKIHHGLSKNLYAATQGIFIDDVETTEAKKTSAYSTNLTTGTHVVRIQTKRNPILFELCKHLFRDCTTIIDAVIPKWSTKNQTDLRNMFEATFEACINLGSVSIPTDWNITATNVFAIFNRTFKGTAITSFATSLWSCGGANADRCFNNAFPETVTTFTIKGKVPLDDSGNVINTQFDFSGNQQYQALTNVTRVNLEYEASATYGMVRWFPNAEFYVGTGTDVKKLTAFELYNCTCTSSSTAGDPRLRLENVDATVTINNVTEFIPSTGYDTIVTQLCTPFQDHLLTFTADKNQYFVVEGIDSNAPATHPIILTYDQSTQYYPTGNIPLLEQSYAILKNDEIFAGPHTYKHFSKQTASEGDIVKILTPAVLSGNFWESINVLFNNSFQYLKASRVSLPAWNTSACTNFALGDRECEVQHFERYWYDASSSATENNQFALSLSLNMRGLSSIVIHGTIPENVDILKYSATSCQIISTLQSVTYTDSDPTELFGKLLRADQKNVVAAYTSTTHHFGGKDYYLTLPYCYSIDGITDGDTDSAHKPFFTEVGSSTTISALAPASGFDNVCYCNKDASSTNLTKYDCVYTPTSSSMLVIEGIKQTGYTKVAYFRSIDNDNSPIRGGYMNLGVNDRSAYKTWSCTEGGNALWGNYATLTPANGGAIKHISKHAFINWSYSTLKWNKYDVLRAYCIDNVPANTWDPYRSIFNIRAYAEFPMWPEINGLLSRSRNPGSNTNRDWTANTTGDVICATPPCNLKNYIRQWDNYATVREGGHSMGTWAFDCTALCDEASYSYYPYVEFDGAFISQNRIVIGTVPSAKPYYKMCPDASHGQYAYYTRVCVASEAVADDMYSTGKYPDSVEWYISVRTDVVWPLYENGFAGNNPDIFLPKGQWSQDYRYYPVGHPSHT